MQLFVRFLFCIRKGLQNKKAGAKRQPSCYYYLPTYLLFSVGGFLLHIKTNRNAYR